jgi:protocatechuate 3,4-dioxygenase beta subunit
MGGMSSAMTDSYNFLRGGWQTNDNGIVTFNTIFPGFCESQLNSIKMKKLILFNRYRPYDSYSYHGSSKYHI